MRTISIIGSESFIAQNLIEYIDKYIKNINILLYDFKSIEEVKCNHQYKQIDFSNKDSICNINFDVDSILVFIGKTGNVNGFDDYNTFLDVNEKYFLNILHGYVENDSKARLIYPGSRLVFDESTGMVNENSEWNPKSIYAVTKMACEYYLKIYNACFGLDYVVLRICTPFDSIIESKGNYGTYELFYHQAINDGVVKVFGDGEQRKTYTHMQDVCLAFYKLIMADSIKYRNYNLGGQALSINEVASSIAKKCSAEVIHTEWQGIYKKVDGGSVVFDSKRFDHEFEMEYKKII